MLPDTFLRAWDHDDPQKLGGAIELAGLDFDDLFIPRGIKDHPWIGQTVQFPFPEVGEGKIVNCVIHPYGRLMFDVLFPNPVPPIHGSGPDNFRVVLNARPIWHQMEHRFFGHELKQLDQLATDVLTPKG